MRGAAQQENFREFTSDGAPCSVLGFSVWVLGIQQVLDYRDDGVQKKPPDNQNPDNRGIYYNYDNLYCSKWSKISRYCEE